MATTYLSPLGNEQQNDQNGAPLSGGKIYTYAAGTTTPIATYMDNSGAVGQSNPITLNTSGLPNNPIWLPAGQAVKMVFTDANLVVLRTVDNIVGINDPSGISIDQWVIYTGAPSFISATSFSVAGDQRNTFQIGRRVRTANSGGTVYGTITNVAFAAVTTVTVVNDSGVLDSGLSQVSYGLISQTSSALPRGPAFSAYLSSNQSVASGVPAKVLFDTEDFDFGSCFASSRFTPTVAGLYQVSAQLSMSVASGFADGTLHLYKNGAAFERGGQLNIAGPSIFSPSYSGLISMNGTTDYLEVFGTVTGATPSFNGNVLRLTKFAAFLARPA